MPPDPPEDRLGWENGVWHNETLNVTASDGLNDSELDAVVARTMARVEHVRGLEFERTPPVRLISKAQQRNETRQQFGDVNRSSRVALNTQYEALFLINESTNAVDSQQALFGGGVSGYYNTSDRNITMVSPTEDVLRLQENVLAQELFHALQDQRFNFSTNISTIEERNARNGIVEGDANYVQYRYEQWCEGEWDGTCLIQENAGQASAEPPANLSLGMVQIYLQPYNAGLDFVRDRERAEGWDAVDAVYEQPPASTEQTIHPEKYPSDTPTNLSVPDRSADGWKPLTQNGERVTGSVGEAGLFVSLWFPSYETRGRESIIPLQRHIMYNATTRQPQKPVTYNYTHRITAGWDGDRLVPYVTNGTGTNDTGYVYETAWDSPTDARQFQDGYTQLLKYHDAEPVDGRTDTYRISNGSEFADAFYVARNGSRVTIVNAPTVDALSAVRQGAAPQADETTTDGSANDNDRPTTEAPTTTDEDEGEATTTDGSGPGFGITATVVALAALLVARSRRQSN